MTDQRGHYSSSSGMGIVPLMNEIIKLVEKLQEVRRESPQGLSESTRWNELAHAVYQYKLATNGPMEDMSKLIERLNKQVGIGE